MIQPRRASRRHPPLSRVAVLLSVGVAVALWPAATVAGPTRAPEDPVATGRSAKSAYGAGVESSDGRPSGAKLNGPVRQRGEVGTRLPGPGFASETRGATMSPGGGA